MRIATGNQFLTAAALLGMCAVSSGQGSSVVCNGTNVNPLTLTNTSTNVGAPTNAPTIGFGLELTLDCSGHSPSLAVLVLGIGEPIGIPSKLVPPLPSRWGEIIVNIGGPAERTPLLVHTGGVVSGSLQVPPLAVLVGAAYTVQGFCGGSPRGQLSNALFEVIGQSG